MSLEWITPKTDWTISTPFTYVDYNRIRNNLLYLNDKFNEMYPDKAQTLDLGEAKTGYTNEYYPSEFNAFEEALISFKRIGQNANIGSRNYYKSNGDFISYNDLNRIESCCLRWNDLGFVDITTFRIEPTSASFDVGDTKTFNVIIEPSNATRKNDWVCNEDSFFECRKTSNTTFSARNIKGVSDMLNDNLIRDTHGIRKGSVGEFHTYYSQRDILDGSVLYNVKNIDGQGNYIYSDNANFVLKNCGSYMISEKNGNYPYVYHQFILIGNGIDGSNIATLLTNTTKVRENDYIWGTDTTTNNYHDDRVAPWRSVFEDIVNNEYSNNLKNALKSVSKVVHFSGTSTGNYSAKAHLLAVNEIGFTDIHFKTLGNTTYPYLINSGLIMSASESAYTDNKFGCRASIFARSLYDDIEGSLYDLPPDNKCGVTIEDTMFVGAPNYIGSSSDDIHKFIEPWGNPWGAQPQPMIFVDKSTHVKLYEVSTQHFSTDNPIIYTFDWTNQSELTLNDLPLGSIIIDANGTNATLASSVELWDYNNFKIGSFSGTAGTLTNSINVKVQPSNCSTMDNIVVRTYDENIASVDNIRIQGNVVYFTLHSNNVGSTYLEASLDGKSHTVEVITRPLRD